MERGIELMKMCRDELVKRMPIDFKGLAVKVVTKDGVKEIDLETFGKGDAMETS